MTTHTAPKANGTPTWLDLTTPDPEAARAFYHAVFGWEYNISGPEFGYYTEAHLGQKNVAGISAPQPDAPEIPSAWYLFFASDTINTHAEQAASLGAQTIVPPFAVGSFGSMGTFVDPTGSVFSFWQADQHIGTQITDEPGSPAWYELYSPNAAQARDFYTALLGATAEPMPGGMEYYTLKHGNDSIAGIMQIDPSWGPMPAQWVVYFAVADIEATVAKIVEHGGKIMGNIDDTPFGRLAAVADHAGAIFKLLEPPKQ
jgi:uncharacterized protein